MSSAMDAPENGKNGHADHSSEGSQENGSAAKRLKVHHSAGTSLDLGSSNDSKTPTEDGSATEKVTAKNTPGAETGDILSKFTFKKVLKSDASRKMVFIQGESEDGTDVVVIFEKSAFDLDDVEELFTSPASAVLEFQNDIYHNYLMFLSKKFNATKTTLIYPATPSHIAKFGQQLMYVVDETPEDYRTLTLPQLQASQRFDTKWVDNILNHEKETERIVFEDPDKETGFVLLPDLKWDGRNVESLYLIALVHKRGIHSIRDLTADHLAMLTKIKNDATEAITKRYGLAASRIRAFFHYQPTFYHLHIHFTNIQFDAPGRNAEKAHMLTTVITNLQNSEDYYQNATIPFLVGERDGLFALYAHRLKPTDDKTD